MQGQLPIRISLPSPVRPLAMLSVAASKMLDLPPSPEVLRMHFDA